MAYDVIKQAAGQYLGKNPEDFERRNHRVRVRTGEPWAPLKR